MRRWLNRFATFFLIALVPSVVGWGLLVRWNAAGPGRFVRFWSWLADKLAFPLLLRPATDPAKAWLTGGSGLLGAAGFAILVMFWCLMLALPLSFIVAWADWFGRRLQPAHGSTGGYDPYATTPIATLGSPARNVLYLVTIPLAIVWHAARFMARPALITFAIVWTGRFGYLYLTLQWEQYDALARVVRVVERDRRGRFALIGTNASFAHLWSTNLKQSQRLARQVQATPWLKFEIVHHPTHFPYLMKLLALDAALYGVAGGALIGVIFAALKLRSSLRS